MTVNRLDAYLSALVRAHTGAEPQELSGHYLTVPGGFDRIAAGTSVPLLGTHTTQLPSGLIVPTRVADELRLEFIQVYATPGEVLDLAIPLFWVIEQLRTINVLSAIAFTAQWMAELQSNSQSVRIVDARFIAALNLREEPARRAEALLRAGRRFAVPQALILLSKLAILCCAGPENLMGPAGLLPLLSFALHDHISIDPDEDGHDRRAFYAELIANHHLNRSIDMTFALGSFVRRWIEIPSTLSPTTNYEDPSALHAEAVRFDLRELHVVATACWSHAYVNPQSPFVDLKYFEQAGTTPTQTEAVLDHLACGISALRDLIFEEEPNAISAWDFYAFSRYPLVKNDGKYAIISPNLLIERALLWLPYFDIQQYLLENGDKKRLAKFESTVRKSSELYGIEIIRSIAPVGLTGESTLLTEDSLIGQFGTGTKTADAAIDYGTDWVVFEISTHRLRRLAVRAEDFDAVEQDLDLFVRKCQQIHDTVAKLRRRNALRQGSAVTTTFYPILVTTEGFPANVVTNTVLRQKLRAAGILQDADTHPIEFIDLECLEYVEAVQEAGGPTLIEILRMKAPSAWSDDGIHQFMHGRLGLRASPSRRSKELFNRSMKWVTETLEIQNGTE